MLRTEPVGSLPRPASLQRAVLDHEGGLISPTELLREQDAAVDDTLARLQETGSPLISDGEQRRQSFATYPLLGGQGATRGNGEAPVRDARRVDGTARLGAEQPAILLEFADGHHRVLPLLTAGPFRYQNLAAQHLEYARSRTALPIKQAVVSPSMLSLMYPEDAPLPEYSPAEFAADLVNECERDIRAAFSAGAARVTIDFTEGRLALSRSGAHPWAGRERLRSFIDLNNRVLDRFSWAERKNIGVHTCPGGDRDSTHSAQVRYTELLPDLLQLRAGYFLMQASSESDRDELSSLVGQSLRVREGVTGEVPTVFLGVTNPLNPRLETAEEVRDQLVAAARFLPPEYLGSTDDCGFSPYLIDEKPRHGSPDFARDVAFAKIAARVRGTQLASEILSGGAG